MICTQVAKPSAFETADASPLSPWWLGGGPPSLAKKHAPPAWLAPAAKPASPPKAPADAARDARARFAAEGAESASFDAFLLGALDPAT